MSLAVRDVHFRYNGMPVLEDVSFELQRGRILVVLGVNGAGKSTLLKCLNRILRPRRGVVLLDGREVGRMKGREVARRFGYVPQKYGQESLTVFDAVLLGRKPHLRWSVSERDYAVVDEVLGLMGLEGLALRPVEKLSGGETQKVMIARALAQEPEVLLLDEPTNNLDPKSQLETVRLIADAVRLKGLSAVVSLHDLNLALRLGDAFLLLKEGRVHGIVGREGLTREVIREVFGVEAVVAEVAGCPVVVMEPGGQGAGTGMPGR